MKFPVSACPQALPVEAEISSYTTDIFLLIFTADASTEFILRDAGLSVTAVFLSFFI
jgi:hypothetical protein